MVNKRNKTGQHVTPRKKKPKNIKRAIKLAKLKLENAINGWAKDNFQEQAAKGIYDATIKDVFHDGENSECLIIMQELTDRYNARDINLRSVDNIDQGEEEIESNINSPPSG